MRTIDISAKTRELAIKEALEQLGVERDEVHVEILDEGSKGLFGFGARDVKLRVSTDVPGREPERRGSPQRERHPRQHERTEQAPRQEQAPRPRHPQQRGDAQRPRDGREGQRHGDAPRQSQPPRHPKPHRPSEAPKSDVSAPRPERAPRPEPPARKPAPAPRVFNGPPDIDVEALVREVVQRMGIEATISSATDESGAVSVKIESPDSAILIGRKGRSLESLQYLVNRMVPKAEGDEGDRITIDIEGYLDRRQEALEDLARRLADRVRETGRRQRTKPMGPQERRAIHVALEGDETVRTFSVGDAGDRHVVIAPADEKPQERGPRDRGPRGDRRPRQGDRRGPRGIMSPPFPDREEERESPREQSRGEGEGNGPSRRRRRSRRGGRGRGPRPDSQAAAPSDTVESGPQES